MPRLNEGFYTDHCQFYMWEVGGGCLKSDITVSPCPECDGHMYVIHKLIKHKANYPCPKCHGTGVGQKPLPGKLCHEKRPGCLSYFPTLMFSCGEEGG